MKQLPPIVLTLLLSAVGLPSSAESLLQVYQQAKQTNPELRGAAAQQVGAAAEVSQARGALLPQLGLSADYTRFRGEQRTPQQTEPHPLSQLNALFPPPAERPFPENSTSGGYNKAYGHQRSLDLTLTQSLFEVQKWSQLSAAQQTVQLQDIHYKVVQQELMLKTASSYFDTLFDIDTLKRLTVEKKAKARKLHETHQQSNVGVVPIKEYYKAKSEYDLAVAAELQQQHQVENTLEKLRELSGHHHKQLNGLESRDFKPKQLSGAIETWIKQGEQSNLELLSARLQQRIALQNVRGAQAGHLPVLQLVAKSKHSRTYKETVSKAHEVSGGVSLSLPLFSGGQITAKVKAVQSGVVQASEKLEQTQRRMIRMTHEAYHGIQSALRTSSAYQQAITSAQRELDAVEASFNVGTVTFIEVMNARTNLFTAKQELSKAQYTYFRYLLSLKAAAGQLSEQDLQAIDQIFHVVVPTTPLPAAVTPEAGNVAAHPKPLAGSTVA